VFLHYDRVPAANQTKWNPKKVRFILYIGQGMDRLMKKFKRFFYKSSISVSYSRAAKIDTPTTAYGVK
jgi:hypothetical protein